MPNIEIQLDRQDGEPSVDVVMNTSGTRTRFIVVTIDESFSLIFPGVDTDAAAYARRFAFELTAAAVYIEEQLSRKRRR